VHRLQLLLQVGSESRSVGLDLSRRSPSAGQAPLAVLRGSLGLAYVQLSCVTDVGLVCVVEGCDLTELKGILLLLLSYHITPSVVWCSSGDVRRTNEVTLR